MDLFKLVGSIYVDNEKANDSLQKTDEKAQKTGKSFGDVAKGAAKVGTAVVAASSAAVTGIVALANNAASAADTIDKGSIRMGISTDYYQELGYAAGQSGVEMATLEKAAKKLEGTDIDLQSAMDEIMSLGTAEERAAKAAEYFGEAVAYDMSPLIEQSGDSFNDLTKRAHDLGLVLDEDTVSAGVKLGDTMSDVKQSFTAIATNLGGAVMPLVQKFADMIIDFMPFISQAMSKLGPLLEDLFAQLMPPLMELAEQLFPIIMEVIETLLPIIVELASALLPAIVEIISAILPIIPPILALIEEIAPYLVEFVQMLLPIIVELFQKIMPLFVKIVEAILPIIAELLPLIMEILQAIMPILELLLDVIGFIVDVLGNVIEKVLPVIINIIKNVLGPVIHWLSGVIQGVGQVFANVWEWIKGVWNGAAEFFPSLWEKIKNAFSQVGQFFKNIFTSAWTNIKNAFAQVGQFFANIWEGIKNGAKAGLNGLIWLLNKAVDGINAILAPLRVIIVAIGKVFGANWDFNTIAIPHIPQLAKGGQADGGTALVGDKGPELLDMPKGATVIPLNRSSISIGIEELSGKVDRLTGILEALAENQKRMGVYIDGDALVGEITERIDEALGRLATRQARFA